MVNSLIIFLTCLYRFKPLWYLPLYAQAYHETGGFTSPNFKKNKNYFGYGFDGSTYYKYFTRFASVNELISYYKRKGINPYKSIIRGSLANELKTLKYYTDSTTNYSYGLSNGLAKARASLGWVVLFLILFFFSFIYIRKNILSWF